MGEPLSVVVSIVGLIIVAQLIKLIHENTNAPKSTTAIFEEVTQLQVVLQAL